MYKIIGTVKEYENQEAEITKEWGQAVTESVKETAEMLDNTYGADRDIYNDDGGYLVLIPNKESLETYNNDKGSLNEVFDFAVVDNNSPFSHVYYVVNNETVIEMILPKKLFETEINVNRKE